MVKNLPTNAGDTRDVGLIPGSESFPGIGNGNPPVFLPEKIPRTKEPGRLQSMRSQRVSTHIHRLIYISIH